jgi:DNA-binding NtrC family response regulator
MEQKHPILVIDDQIGIPSHPERTAFLRAVGYYPSTGGKEPVEDYPYEFEFHTGQTEAGVNSVEAVKAAVLKRWLAMNGNRWALVLLDVRFDEASGRSDEKFGFTLLRALREDSQFGADLPIVMLTSEDEAKRSLADKFKANGFLPKLDSKKQPFWSRAELEDRVLKYGLIPDDRDDSLLTAMHTTRLLGRSLPLLKVLRAARFYALKLKGSRILYGETGSGKTELAGYVHCYTASYTARRTGPYVHWFADPANRELMKSELFGWWKNAFHGADQPQAGKIEEAQGGTFFLDEIANLPSDIQMAFLQFRKQDADGRRILSRMGKFPRSQRDQQVARQSVVAGAMLLADHRIRVDVLLLTGTQVELEDAKVRKDKGFRDDLHNALGTPLRCPALNQRREDIRELFQAFVRRVLEKPEQSALDFEIEPAVFDLLEQRDWSQRGNMRDLERIAEHAAQQLGDFNTIRVDSLPQDVQEDAKSKSAKPSVELVRNVEASVVPAPTDSPATTAEHSSSAHGSLTRAELEHLKRRASLLEEAVEVTRIDPTTGNKGKCKPTVAVSRLMGKKVSTTNAKRIIKDILGTILNTPAYLVKAYGENELQSAREWVKSKPLLVALYRYAIGEISADEIC